MSEDSATPSKAMSHEERLELAAKLDDELDDFINGLEKRQYTEGWPEDRWEEEMDKHPFFMKKAPEPGEELHPLLEGIQQLKYDPAENTAEELAVSYKEDGNFNFKYKKYRLAILSYTEGIKQKHENKELSASLYNNRSASHFFLKNYRSCIRDCEIALTLKPSYPKASIRAAQCCFEISQWDKCISHCDEVLSINSTDSTALELRQKAINTQKDVERDVRRQKKKNAVEKDKVKKLIEEIVKRGIRLKEPVKKIEDCNVLDILRPIAAQLEGAQVHLDEETGQLVWPVVLVYPEFGIMDFVRTFSEQDTIHSQLSEVFHEPAEWDHEGEYTPDSVSIYFEEETPNGKVYLHQVPATFSLLEVMKHEGYSIRHGTPQLTVLLKGSEREKHFVKQYYSK